MHGNVWEWCQDSYPADYESLPATDPMFRQTSNRRVVRGGSWFDYGDWCRSAFRGQSAPSSRHYGLGLRVVCLDV